jgi:hypothetical protein
MSFLSALKLSPEDHLDTLRRLDHFRRWHSLDEKRYCLGCGKIITGRDIQVIGGTRGIGPLRIVCPTRLCAAIPMDWVLPTEEVLTNSSNRERQAQETRASAGPGESAARASLLG